MFFKGYIFMDNTPQPPLGKRGSKIKVLLLGRGRSRK
jgi:hypothetical protein